jgi:putative oxidoreductase
MNKMTLRADIVALFLRVAGGLLLCLGHGTMKYDALMGRAAQPFPDPLGIGSQLSVVMSMGAECVCSLIVAVGLLTRLSTLPIIFTMCTVAAIVHQGAPWLKREPSVLFLVLYTAIFILGPGRYSIDAWWARRTGKIGP